VLSLPTISSGKPFAVPLLSLIFFITQPVWCFMVNFLWFVILVYLIS
jgi:hypothetical protein